MPCLVDLLIPLGALSLFFLTLFVLKAYPQSCFTCLLFKSGFITLFLKNVETVWAEFPILLMVRVIMRLMTEIDRGSDSEVDD